MKKLLLAIAAFGAVMGGMTMLPSCKEEKHATEICLPDSAMVGKSLPVIDGSLSEYYTVVPQPYVLNLQDSVLSLKVKVRHEKTYVPNRYVSIAVGNPDSLASKYPYLVLVDSIGNPIPNFRLDVDTMMVSQLDALITGEPGMETELTFTSNTPLTVGQKDSLALVARNINMVANLLSTVDTAAIDQILKSYKNAVYQLNDWIAGFGGYPPAGMGARVLFQKLDAEKTQAQIVKSVEPFMTPEQMAEYKKIKASRTKSEYAR